MFPAVAKPSRDDGVTVKRTTKDRARPLDSLNYNPHIIFDTLHNAVLIQNRQEVVRCGIEDPAQLQKLLELFFGYERPEIADFRKAVEQFKTDLPAVLKRSAR